MAFAVYGSLIPFDLKYVPFERAWAEAWTLLFDPPHRRISRSNFLANVLLFVPIGFGLMGMLLADCRRRLLAVPAAMVIVPVSLALSLTIEFLQLFASDRVPSRVDVGAQTIGCAIGITAWVAVGPLLTHWLRETSSRTQGDRLARLLAGYAAAWAFVNLAPFDITLDAGDLGRRLRGGLITIVPYGHAELTPWRIAWDACATAISAAPLGLLGLVAGAGPGARFRRSGLAAFGSAAVLVIGMELAQIFIRSHAADSGDVTSGLLGAAAGVWAGTRILGRGPAQGQLLSHGTPWATGGLIVWTAIVCAYHWMPYDFAVDPGAIKGKLAVISLLPFTGYWGGSYINALNDLLVKIGLSAPLGVMAAFALARGDRVPVAGTVAFLVGVAILFTGIEAGQLFLPTRTPEPTDVLIGTAGAGLGLLLGHWLLSGSGGRANPR